MNDLQIDEKIARVADILEQVDKLNHMIEFHLEQSGETSMARQYEEMRSEFLDELREILSNFNIDIEIKGKAA
jgi:uncharacterized protein YdcH (DUF465 family)